MGSTMTSTMNVANAKTPAPAGAPPTGGLSLTCVAWDRAVATASPPAIQAPPSIPEIPGNLAIPAIPAIPGNLAIPEIPGVLSTLATLPGWPGETPGACGAWRLPAGEARPAATVLRIDAPLPGNSFDAAALRAAFRTLAPRVMARVTALATDKTGPPDVQLDLALTVPPPGGYRALVSDMDGTVLLDETLDDYARSQGFGQAVAALTALSMRGKADFARSLKARCCLLAGRPLAPLAQIADQARLRPGAGEAFHALREAGLVLHLVSGGFDVVVDRVAERLGFHRASSNRLVVEGGLLTGKVALPVLDGAAKRRVLEAEGEPERTIAIGDGANDLEMVARAGMGLAVGALPPLADQASGWILSGRLDALPLFAGVGWERLESLRF